MAIAFATILVVTTLGLVVPFALKWWWLPPLASQHGAGIDQQFAVSMFLCAAIFIPAQFALAYVILRFKDKGGQATYSHGNNTMEWAWTSLALVFFLGMNVMGQHMWAEQRFQEAPKGALEIEVTGQQFVWNIRYPGPDGKFGRTDPKLVSDSSGNPLGLDPQDPVSRDDIVLPTMAVPMNRPVDLILKSKDVTHNFFVPELRVKQDTVPGMAIRVHFTATRIGKYEIACSELCGLGHYKMRSFLEVKSESDFDKWLKEQVR